jgi:hypothetical protein
VEESRGQSHGGAERPLSALQPRPSRAQHSVHLLMTFTRLEAVSVALMTQRRENSYHHPNPPHTNPQTRKREEEWRGKLAGYLQDLQVITPASERVRALQ